MFRKYKALADLGDVESMFQYASMIVENNVSMSSLEEAAYYFKMSADKGNELAMKSYADLLYDGDEEDIKEAAHYY